MLVSIRAKKIGRRVPGFGDGEAETISVFDAASGEPEPNRENFGADARAPIGQGYIILRRAYTSSIRVPCCEFARKFPRASLVVFLARARSHGFAYIFRVGARASRRATIADYTVR